MSSHLPNANSAPARLRAIPLAQPAPEILELPTGKALPRPLTSLIGRDADVAACRLLLEDGVRLLTLTGPGGVGKTRLALRVAEEMTPAFPNGVIFVPLAAITDPELVLPTIARELGLPEIGVHSAHDFVAEFLRDRRLLIILDNFEQVSLAAAQVAPLLSRCPGIVLLATSRALLQIAGEQRFPVAPLAVDESEVGSRKSEEGSQTARRSDDQNLRPPTSDFRLPFSPAVQLFVARAQAADPHFALSEEHAATVAAICRRLDGLPLAIELAAARLRHLSPAELLARMRTTLPLLTGGPADAPGRLRTMHQAIAWSYDLLSADEQALFRRLAIFVGGFTFEAAEYVGGDGFASVLDLLAALIDKSLVHVQTDGVDTRLMMLETVREFAITQLAASGEEATIRDRHAMFFLALAEATEIPIADLVRPEDLDPVEAELANLRAALDWLLGSGRAERALRMAAALFTFWWENSHISEGRAWSERVLTKADDAASPAIQAKALVAAGVLAAMQDDLARASEALTAGLALAREVKEPRVLAWAHAANSFLELIGGRLDEAERHAAEAVRIGAALGDHGSVFRAMLGLGRIAAARGDWARAETVNTEALDRARRIGSRWADHFMIALALVAQARGDYARAAQLHAETFGVGRHMSNVYCALMSLEGIAITAAERAPAAAARLLGAAAALHRAHMTSPLPTDRPGYERAVQTVTAKLGEASFAAAWAAGSALSLDEAIAEFTALAGEASQVTDSSLGDTSGFEQLTAREREILRLLVDGQSDKEIALALRISAGTVSKHVLRIRDKLKAPSRTAAATLAIRYGLV